ncbi:tyrosine-type recombinase/integrase [Desulforhopalus singaporensis]|uniref:Phage integrase family protein n=1 Tax=Desulforhopalus singaporensis TaxID=91360 RepID=A0A1H0NU79_9BACT|nr:tyrosine-type recombinase/integrase [Desulforhopalus singaporensis]SDO96229.1 Phage integrase family protein [Desulforhopalus singaporensis]
MAKNKKPMRNIEARETRWGMTYRVRVQYKGQVFQATRDKLSEAIEWREQTEHLLHTGQPLPGEVPEGDMKLGEASDKFIKGCSHKSRATINGYHFAQNKILDYFGDKTLLSQITPSRMYEYVTHRQNIDGVGSSKLCQELSFIKMVYDAARTWGVTVESPERNIVRPKKKHPSREEKLDRVIKENELIVFLEKIRSGHINRFITSEKYLAKFGDRNKTLYLYLMFLLHTGMRPTEAAYLRWSPPTAREIKESKKKAIHLGHVDLERGGFSKVGTKTETRFVPAHPVAAKIIRHLEGLRSAKEQQLREQLEKRNGPGSGTKDDCTLKYVFIPNSHGQKTHPYKIYRSAFETARTNTFLQDGSRLRQNIDFYSFRHTARSRMAICGVQDSAAEEIIGHVGDRMQKTYTHYDDAGLIAQISKLDYPELHLNL